MPYTIRPQQSRWSVRYSLLLAAERRIKLIQIARKPIGKTRPVGGTERQCSRFAILFDNRADGLVRSRPAGSGPQSRLGDGLLLLSPFQIAIKLLETIDRRRLFEGRSHQEF